MKRWLWLGGTRDGLSNLDTSFATRLTRAGKLCGFAVKFRGRWYGVTTRV